MDGVKVNTVNIPIDEYFELKTKAEMNGFLINQMGQIEGRYFDLDRRILEIEFKLKGVLKDERKGC